MSQALAVSALGAWLLFVPGTTLRAQTPPIIYACVNPGNGNLRMVSATESCRPREVKVQWTTTGAQGPAGPPGPAGGGGPALTALHQPRDLELYTGTQAPALIYHFTGTFLTRVILIGPSLATDDPGVMAVGAEITIQANGKAQ